MSGLIDSAEHLERELSPEPIAAPAFGAIALHLALGLLLGYYAWILGLFHHNVWGNAGAGGAMQVNLVSPLPLPSTQVNQNVVATETPSPAPAPPSPKEQHQVDETAIPIPGKQTKPKQKTTPKTQQHQPVPQQNRAAYGEQQGSSMPRTMSQQAASNGPTSVGDNDFASMFGYYVDQINRKMSQNGYRSMVDPRTPAGARAYIVFTISRDGSASNVQLARTSGSPTLDMACVRAAQRVDTFGPLPGSYNKSTLNVSYYCEY
jgi:periplasmic protein TonB